MKNRPLPRTVKRKTAKKLKKHDEFVAKNPMEQDKQEWMMCPCVKRGIPGLGVNC